MAKNSEVTTAHQRYPAEAIMLSPHISALLNRLV